MGITYKDVGVDVVKIGKTHNRIASILRSTYNDNVISGYGHYSGLISISDDTALAVHTDGVGTKTLIASLAERYNTIGVDCIAMNVNDIICVGAKPIAFVDYLAVSRLDEDMIEEIMDGLASGAKEAEVPIVGGETAVIPDMFADRLSDVKAKKGRGGRGRVMQDGLPIDNVFDLSGTVIGIAKKDELILGESIAIGDVIVGIESNGLHANGYTLVRHVLLSKYTLEDTPEGLSSKLKDELLRPTRIYVKPTLELIEHADVHGIAHVTGGAYRKLTRLKDDVRFTIEHDVEQEIFNVIKRHARIDDREMYSTFNMGIGLCVIVAKGDEDYTISTYNRYGMNAKVIGRIDEGRGVYINGIRITT